MPAIVTVETARVHEAPGARSRVALAAGRGCSRPILALREEWLRGRVERAEQGVALVCVVVDGQLVYRDGDERGSLAAGDVQWATAGRGVVLHEAGDAVRRLLVSVDLPAAEKGCAPSVQDLHGGDIPVVDHGSARVRVIAGSHAGVRGPARCPTPVSLLDVIIEPRGGGCTVDAACVRGLAYVYDGEVGIAGAAVRAGEVALLDVRGTVPLDVDARGGARLLVVTAPTLY